MPLLVGLRHEKNIAALLIEITGVFSVTHVKILGKFSNEHACWTYFL